MRLHNWLIVIRPLGDTTFISVAAYARKISADVYV